jgi:hypothetical protein
MRWFRWQSLTMPLPFYSWKVVVGHTLPALIRIDRRSGFQSVVGRTRCRELNSGSGHLACLLARQSGKPIFQFANTNRHTSAKLAANAARASLPGGSIPSSWVHPRAHGKRRNARFFHTVQRSRRDVRTNFFQSRWTGDKDLACEQLAAAIRHPSSLSYADLNCCHFGMRSAETRALSESSPRSHRSKLDVIQGKVR